jgi:hypothetical protein
MSNSAFLQLFDEFLAVLANLSAEAKQATFSLVQDKLSEVASVVRQHEQKEQEAQSKRESMTAMIQPSPSAPPSHAESGAPLVNLSKVSRT